MFWHDRHSEHVWTGSCFQSIWIASAQEAFVLFANGTSGKGPSWTKAQWMELRAYPTFVTDCYSSATRLCSNDFVDYLIMKELLHRPSGSDQEGTATLPELYGENRKTFLRVPACLIL